MTSLGRSANRARTKPTREPQQVAVHGGDEVVVISTDECQHSKGNLTGEALIAAMQASPHRDIDIEPGRLPLPVRDVKL